MDLENRAETNGVVLSIFSILRYIKIGKKSAYYFIPFQVFFENYPFSSQSAKVTNPGRDREEKNLGSLSFLDSFVHSH